MHYGVLRFLPETGWPSLGYVNQSPGAAPGRALGTVTSLASSPPILIRLTNKPQATTACLTPGSTLTPESTAFCHSAQDVGFILSQKAEVSKSKLPWNSFLFILQVTHSEPTQVITPAPSSQKGLQGEHLLEGQPCWPFSDLTCNQVECRAGGLPTCDSVSLCSYLD